MSASSTSRTVNGCRGGTTGAARCESACVPGALMTGGWTESGTTSANGPLGAGGSGDETTRRRFDGRSEPCEPSVASSAASRSSFARRSANVRVQSVRHVSCAMKLSASMRSSVGCRSRSAAELRRQTRVQIDRRT